MHCMFTCPVPHCAYYGTENAREFLLRQGEGRQRAAAQRMSVGAVRPRMRQVAAQSAQVAVSGQAVQSFGFRAAGDKCRLEGARRNEGNQVEGVVGDVVADLSGGEHVDRVPVVGRVRRTDDVGVCVGSDLGNLGRLGFREPRVGDDARDGGVRAVERHGQPGAGRKLTGAAPLDAKVHIRLEVEQRDLFSQLGGVKWLRGALARIKTLLDRESEPPADLESPEVLGVLPQTLEALLLARVREAGDVEEAGERSSDGDLRPSGLRQYDAAEVLFGRKTLPGERRSERRLFVLRAAGDAMIDAGIGAGDIVVVDAARRPKSGEIVCMRVNGARAIRRIFFDEAAVGAQDDPLEAPGVRFVTENSAAPYAEMRPEPWQRFEIEGTVVSAVTGLLRRSD